MRYFIGWDVGAWHCEECGKSSKDAIAVLDENQCLLGLWEGNLCSDLAKNEQIGIVTATEFLDFVMSKCDLCDSRQWNKKHEYVLAIDTPLGWPKAFRELICHFSVRGKTRKPGTHNLNFSDKIKNPLLHRETETILGKALSAVQDQIGSQSTKALFLLRAMGANRVQCGVWEVNGANLSIIETYPSPCIRSLQFIERLAKLNAQTHVVDSVDKFDAIVCAAAGFEFSRPKQNNILLFPPEHIDSSEGWIFRPNDLLKASFAISYGKLIGQKHGFTKLLSQICTGTALEVAIRTSKKGEATDKAILAAWSSCCSRTDNSDANELKSLFKLLHPKTKEDKLLISHGLFAQAAETMRREFVRSAT